MGSATAPHDIDICKSKQEEEWEVLEVRSTVSLPYLFFR